MRVQSNLTARHRLDRILNRCSSAVGTASWLRECRPNFNRGCQTGLPFSASHMLEGQVAPIIHHKLLGWPLPAIILRATVATAALGWREAK